MFEIKEEFYLNGEPFKIISGAVHYFRTVPSDWRDRLIKLNNLGCNTVETYVPWNMHEPKEGTFDFEGILNLREFIKLAQEIGLYVILRPSPYICAEWEFGGLPAWLLKYNEIKIRTSDELFLSKVASYFKRLFKEFVDLQIDTGGPIILMQVENEYGSYGSDKLYLTRLAEMMRENGATVPFITSDGPWGDMLMNGTIPELALPTVNCGSQIDGSFDRLAEFLKEKKPLMVTEFWIGWFDAWGDQYHHTTNIENTVKELEAILKRGSVNIYMFHGGTNFGFMNGSNYSDHLTPDVTSYDYDALLTENGDITSKYEAFKAVITKYNPHYRELPLAEKEKIAVHNIPVQNKVSLFSVLDDLSMANNNLYPQSMEVLNQSTGYIYYETDLGFARNIEDFRLIGCADRAQIYVNGKWQFTQCDVEIGKQESFVLEEETNRLGILVENMGRVNYAFKMNDQQKGIKQGVIINRAFKTEWRQYSLPMNNLDKIDFSKTWQEGIPSFYQFLFTIDKIGDTFIDMSGWGKGFVLVNGINIGRFWQKGPQKRLYVPASFLKENNEIIVFESEGIYQETIVLNDQPDLGPVEL